MQAVENNKGCAKFALVKLKGFRSTTPLSA